LFAGTAGIFAGWVLLHLPATRVADWLAAQLGFHTYDLIFLSGTICVLLATYTMIWRCERNVARPGLFGHALLLLPFVGLAETLLIIGPVESVHFPQYALIAVLIGSVGAAKDVAWLLAIALGALDELHQLVALRSGRPDYFDWNDVVLNAIGAAFGVAILLAGNRRHEVPGVSRERGVAAFLLAAGIALLVAFPTFVPFLTTSLRGSRFRILSAFEGLVLLAALWWVVQGMLAAAMRPGYGHGDRIENLLDENRRSTVRALGGK
jgi:hypothetical protein